MTPRSKLRGILRNSTKPLPSFAKATEGSPAFIPVASYGVFGEGDYADCQAKNAWQLVIRLQENCRSWDFHELLALLCKARKLRRLSGVGLLAQQGFISA